MSFVIFPVAASSSLAQELTYDVLYLQRSDVAFDNDSSDEPQGPPDHRSAISKTRIRIQDVDRLLLLISTVGVSRSGSGVER